MSIFRRNKNAGESAAQEAPDAPEPASSAAPAVGAAPDRQDGPFDVEEAPHGREGRIDLGAIWVRVSPGMELRLEVEQQTQDVTSVTAVLGESSLQLQAFAAPRSGGLWAQIRREIAMAIETQGGTVEEVPRPLGTELRTRMPSSGPDGRTVFAPATFIGVDGPRWFLRGVLSGRAAIDEAAAEPLMDLLRDVVVVRGVEPMAPRELLPLQLPQEARPQEAAPEEDAQDTPAADTDLNPFERGPEITEVR